MTTGHPNVREVAHGVESLAEEHKPRKAKIVPMAEYGPAIVLLATPPFNQLQTLPKSSLGYG